MKILDDENLRVRYDRQGMIQVLDRFSVQCAEAIEAGVQLIIGTDAHTPEHLNFLELGILTAKHGWTEPRHVLNTLPVDEFLSARKWGE